MCEFASASLTVGQLNAYVKASGGAEAVLKVLSGKAKVVIEEIKEVLLALVATITIMPRATKFVVQDELSVGDHDGLKIISWGDNFKKWFGGKLEELTSTTQLVVSRLIKSANDKEIIDSLGGEEKAETAMSEFHAALAKQGNGQKGDLRTDGYANIVYIRDINGILRAVDVYWNGGGWRLHADAVDDPVRWGAGGRVVSRK